nr:hypothetical protein [Tanacetum cinerariifolium]
MRGGGGKNQKSHVNVTIGSSSDFGFPSLTEVADTLRTQDRGLSKGNIVTDGSIGQVSEANVVASVAPDATNAPSNAGTPNEVGHESVIKEIPAS